MASLESPSWNPILEHLRSICFNNPEVRLNTLPTMFEKAPKCVFACLSAKSLGTASEPLHLVGGIAIVSRLALCCEAIHVNIPSYARWSEICFHSFFELDIRHAFAIS